jgi:replicative DNA helicase
VIQDDVDEFLDEYALVESSDQLAGRNLFGLEPVDSVCKGHRRGEYWVHCAFAGELKTTTALNYAYNNAMVYGKNIFYAILEMPYKQLRRNLYVIHSSHGKFVTRWHGEDGYLGLDYRQVRDGELNPRDKERLRIVARDFHQSCRGRIFVWRPPGEASMDDIRRKAEMFHNKYGCDGIVIDHLGLVQPQHRTNDYVVSLNTVVREGRMMALNFARGVSVPVLALFQLNRQGKLRADKADGRYDMAAISYANEIEKSADEVTYTYLNDELRRAGKFYLGCLKNRDNPVFERMVGKILWRTKRIRALETGFIDFDTDRLVQAASQISAELGLNMESMIA